MQRETNPMAVPSLSFKGSLEDLAAAIPQEQSPRGTGKSPREGGSRRKKKKKPSSSSPRSPRSPRGNVQVVEGDESDLVTAVFYEKRVVASASSKEPVGLLHFPERDLEVRTVARASTQPTDTALAQLLEARGYVASCLRGYMRDYLVVAQNYDQFDGKSLVPRLATAAEVPEKVVDDIHQVVQSKEPIAMSLLQPLGSHQLKQSASRREAIPRESLFAWFTSPSTPEKPSDMRPLSQITAAPSHTFQGTSSLLQSSGKTRAFVHVKSLKFLTGKHMEPVFVTMTIFDVRKKERITESMTFLNVNPDEVNHMLGARWEAISQEMLSNRVLFPVDDLSPDLYLVIFVEKTLRATDVDDAVDELQKYATLPKKAQAKVDDDIRMSAVRLGSYRQPLGFVARCLFEQGRSLIGTDIVIDGFQKFKPGLANDAQVIAHLEKLSEKSVKSTASSARGRAETGRGARVDPKMVVPIQMTLDFDLLDKDAPLLHNVLTPSLVRRGQGNAQEVVRTAQHFSAPENVMDPHREIVNDLYVFLDLLNLTKAGRRVQNVVITVSLLDSDEDPANAKPLPLVYGRSGKLTGDVRCSVQFQEKRLSLYEQVKVRLPSVLHSMHHLLFRFASVEARLSKMKSAHDSLETVIGYAVFPVFPNNRVVRDGSYAVPVINSLHGDPLPPKYLSTDTEQHMEYVGNKERIFSFHTKAISTIYTQDPSLDAWFQLSPAAMTDCSLLSSAATYEKIQFLPPILDRLWEMMCLTGRDQVAVEGLLQAIALCDAITLAAHRGVRYTIVESEILERNQHLVNYVLFEFDEDMEAFEGVKRVRSKPLYIVLLDCMYALVMEGGERAASLAPYLWFFFDLICKSLALHLHREKLLELGGPTSRADRIASDVPKQIERVVVLLGRQLRLRTWVAGPLVVTTNWYVALFLKDLLSLLDRGWVMELINRYVEGLMPPKGEERLFVGLQWKCLRVVADHPHYIPLNLPVPKKVSQAAHICSSFFRNHYLAGLLLRNLRTALIEYSDPKLRQPAVTVVREMLRKHDADARYQSAALQKRVSRIYFPYILILLEGFEVVENMEPAEQREWLVVVLWILRHLNRKSVAQKWWILDTNKAQRQFLQLLLLCVKAFAASAHLLSECILVVLDVLEPFLTDLQDALRSDQLLLDDAFALVHTMLDVTRTAGAANHHAAVTGCLLDTVRHFVHLFSGPLFERSESSRYCGGLAFQVLQLCNCAHGEVRSAAAAILYLLMRTNFSLRRNFARMKLQATIAVSKFQASAATDTVYRTDYLESSLKAVAACAVQEFGAGGTEAAAGRRPSVGERQSEFALQVDALTRTLFRVIRDSGKIQEYKYDRERMCDYMYQVSLGYAADSPDLRVTWLNNLADYHLANGNYQEHAQCKLLAAALVCELLHQQNSALASSQGIPASLEYFEPICPNVHLQPALQKFAQENLEEGMYESQYFSLHGFMDLLKEVCFSLRMGQCFELAIQVENLLVTVYQYQRNYQKMGVAFASMRSMVQQMLDADQKQSRSFAAFYRVSFYGAGWGEDLAGRGYIYKADEYSQIAEVTAAMEEQFKRVVPSLVRLGNKEVDVSELKPDVCYWQIAAVKEYFAEHEVAPRAASRGSSRSATPLSGTTPKLTKRGHAGSAAAATKEHQRQDSLLTSTDIFVQAAKKAAERRNSGAPSKEDIVPWEMRVSKWERKFNVRKFLLEQPFSKIAGKAQQEGNPLEQWKRKLVYTCEFAFPFVNKRSLITDVQKIELSPIETTIEMIEEQTAAFEAECNRNPPVLNGLQRVCQGSILTQVNVGVLYAAKLFLSKPLDFPLQFIKQLSVAMAKFVTAAGVAVDLNQRLIGADQLDLQRALEDGLKNMKDELARVKADLDKALFGDDGK